MHRNTGRGIGLGSWLLCACFLTVCAVGPASVRGEDWPGWRGPRGDGTSQESAIPLKWDGISGENIAWMTTLKSHGHSSPIIVGESIYVTGAEEATGRRMLTAFERDTGLLKWEREVLAAPLEKKHKLNSWASGTPACDGQTVYVTFLKEKTMHVAAYGIDGTPRWAVEPGGFSSVHGYCSSPVVFENLVLVNGDHDGDSYLVALDRATGATVWKTPREYKTRSYCTPIIRTIEGRTQMILSGSKCVASYDPRTGKQLWLFDGPTEQFVASPVMNAGLVFITGGFPDKHILAIDPRGSGKITEASHVKWHHLNKGVSYVPSPVSAGSFFFCVADGGIASCYDALDGTVRWQERLGCHHSGSLVSTADRVYFLDDDGVTHVVAASGDFQVLATNPLGEETYSSPALSEGQIFIRGEGHLFAIGKTGK